MRIALELKGLRYEYLPVNLVRGEHKRQPFAALVADALVPVLEVDGHHLSQSMAIIEYLDQTRPTPPLLPAEALGRAQVRALAQLIACEIHPLNNLRVLKYLARNLQLGDAARNDWYRHWVREGLLSFERQLQINAEYRERAGIAQSLYCYGETPTLADCCLVPQIFNGRRYEVNFEGLTRTLAAFEACMQLDAFERAQPLNCPDYEDQ